MIYQNILSKSRKMLQNTKFKYNITQTKITIIGECKIMKTVAIVGSPRKDGNCDILVNKLLEKIDGEKSIYYLNELDIGFCKACQACQKGDCVKDDDARKIITEMLEADLFIFSSPIYYGQMSGQAKTLIDRFYQVSQNPDKTLEGTKVIEIFTQAQPSDAFAAYIDSMKVIPFGYMGMEIVDTIVAKGAAGKGDGLEEAIAQIEKIGDKL